MNTKLKFIVLFITLAQVVSACTTPFAAATSAPTVVPTPTKDPLASAKVVQAFWDAMAAGDIETAMSYVGDDITCEVFCHFSGKDIFKTYLQGYLDAGFVTKIGDLKNVGSIVTYSWEVYRHGIFLRRGEDDEMMEVEDGKIVYWENYHR
ncbi:MAG TPA: nuclear transport factor 2 family protein [Anaerolineales bacterium]|nr:nuclear transport factor 2 family protein [Anaerolineales bacterium]